jgi:AcrR family transcriptional regulator
MSTTSRLGDAGVVVVTQDIIVLIGAFWASHEGRRRSGRVDGRTSGVVHVTPCATCTGYGWHVGRRDDVIAAATALLRESGPDALTSVDIAQRLGLTQSAIYRHVQDMDEVTMIASRNIIDELSAVVIAAVASPEPAWIEGTHIANIATRIIELIGDHEQAVAAIGRWRHGDDELGEGIRVILDIGTSRVATEYEAAWRHDFGSDTPFDGAASAMQRAHAGLVIDDVIAVVQSLGAAGPEHRQLVERMLGLRLFAGWCAYVMDLNTRMGVPIPALGGPLLTSPEYPLT